MIKKRLDGALQTPTSLLLRFFEDMAPLQANIVEVIREDLAPVYQEAPVRARLSYDLC